MRATLRIVPPGAPPPEVTWADVAEGWLATYIATMRNAKGRRLARVRVERYTLPFLTGRTLDALVPDDVRHYRLALEDLLLLSPHTVTHVLSDLRCMLRWAVGAGLIARSPFPDRVMPRIPEAPPRGFSPLELELLRAQRGNVGFVLRLLLATGLRWAEACRASRADVRGALLEVAQTKNGRVRRVPLGPALREEISTRTRRLVPYAAGSPGSFSRTVRRATGIADFHVHRCRHAFAMNWLAAGGNLAVLQQVLGHRDLTTTMRYARVTDELIEREAARVAAAQGDGERT